MCKTPDLIHWRSQRGARMRMGGPDVAYQKGSDPALPRKASEDGMDQDGLIIHGFFFHNGIEQMDMLLC